jgi:hypothetical protein
MARGKNDHDGEQRIADSGDLRKYRTELPNMADDTMDPFQYRLYGHYKRVCGANGGSCYESVRKTARNTQMSTDKVISTRQWLIDNEWIGARQDSNGVYHINIIDRWLENFIKYSGITVRDLEQPVRNSEREAFDISNLRKNHTKKELIKKEPDDDDALASPFVKADRRDVRSVRADQATQPESAALRLAAHRFGRLAFPNGGFDNLAGYIDGLSADRLNSFCAACYLSELKARRGVTKINDPAAFVRSMADKGKWPGFSPIEAEQFEQCMAAYVSGLESDIWEEFPESEYTQ